MGLILGALRGLDEGLPASAGGITDVGQLVTLSPFVFPSCSIGRLVSCTLSVGSRGKHAFKGFLVAVKTWQHLLTQTWVNIFSQQLCHARMGQKDEKKNHKTNKPTNKKKIPAGIPPSCMRQPQPHFSAPAAIELMAAPKHLLHIFQVVTHHTWARKPKKAAFQIGQNQNWNTSVVKKTNKQGKIKTKIHKALKSYSF